MEGKSHWPSLCYSLDAPCYHCPAHGSDIVIKRMSKSKTMSVPKLSKPIIGYEGLLNITKWVSKARRNWIKHWQYLNQLKLLLRGEGTRMTHFITVCKQLIKLPLAAYNCMYSTDTKKKIGMHYSLLKHFCASFNEWFKVTVQRYLSGENGQGCDTFLNGISNCHGHCWPN